MDSRLLKLPSRSSTAAGIAPRREGAQGHVEARGLREATRSGTAEGLGLVAVVSMGSNQTMGGQTFETTTFSPPGPSSEPACPT